MRAYFKFIGKYMFSSSDNSNPLVMFGLKLQKFYVKDIKDNKISAATSTYLDNSFFIYEFYMLYGLEWSEKHFEYEAMAQVLTNRFVVVAKETEYSYYLSAVEKLSEFALSAASKLTLNSEFDKLHILLGKFNSDALSNLKGYAWLSKNRSLAKFLLFVETFDGKDIASFLENRLFMLLLFASDTAHMKNVLGMFKNTLDGAEYPLNTRNQKLFEELFTLSTSAETYEQSKIFHRAYPVLLELLELKPYFWMELAKPEKQAKLGNAMTMLWADKNFIVCLFKMKPLGLRIDAFEEKKFFKQMSIKFDIKELESVFSAERLVELVIETFKEDKSFLKQVMYWNNSGIGTPWKSVLVKLYELGVANDLFGDLMNYLNPKQEKLFPPREFLADFQEKLGLLSALIEASQVEITVKSQKMIDDLFQIIKKRRDAYLLFVARVASYDPRLVENCMTLLIKEEQIKTKALSDIKSALESKNKLELRKIATELYRFSPLRLGAVSMMNMM